MKRALILTTVFLSVLAQAQNSDAALFPGAKPVESGVTVPDGMGSEPGVFQKGGGAQIDTIDIGDERLQIVLCDDGTWHYIKNFSTYSDSDVFADHWDTENINPYRDELSSLPVRNSICLVDTLSKWTCPYQGAVISKFGYRWHRAHMGVDIPYPMGTPVAAAFDGRVRISMYTKGYGNLIVIRHENGLETFYGHLSRRDVYAGDWVSSGDIIGLGGSTGRSTGPHLHFETRYHGFAFDPQWMADFEKGKLRKNILVLKRTYFSPSSHYVPDEIEEEEDVYGEEERIIAEEKRIAEEKASIRYHTVRSGETIGSIAIKEHVSQAKIKNLNPKLNINRISIGQKIRVN